MLNIKDNNNFDQILTEEERNALALIVDEKEIALNQIPLLFWILVATTLAFGVFWGSIASFFPETFASSMVTFSVYSQEEAIQIIQNRGQRILFLSATFFLALYNRLAMRYVAGFIIIFLIYNVARDIRLLYIFDSFQTSAAAILFFTCRIVALCGLIFIWLELRASSLLDKVFPRKIIPLLLNKFLRFVKKS